MAWHKGVLTTGSITTTLTNPIWTVQAYQSTRAVAKDAEGNVVEKPSMVRATKDIIKQSGVKGLWRGLGPALILVINPVIQVSFLPPSCTIF